MHHEPLRPAARPTCARGVVVVKIKVNTSTKLRDGIGPINSRTSVRLITQRTESIPKTVKLVQYFVIRYKRLVLFVNDLSMLIKL